MTMYDSPLEYCPVVKDYVAIDQTEHQCAVEHCCDRRESCPLLVLFADTRAKEGRKRRTAALA